MAKPIIAIICDFDGTLGPDMITFLLEQHGIEPQPFWDEISTMVEEGGWDPAQAYMYKLLSCFNGRRAPRLTKNLLRKLGSKLELFPGIPQLFSSLRKYVQTNRQLKSISSSIELKYYIVSGGLEEMIRGTRVAEHMNGIFGCDFHYNEATKFAQAVKKTISFTEKTKFIYAINKGITHEEMQERPYSVNDHMPEQRRPIPFSHMIYIGDGPSDIPCMSMIKKNGGVVIGVSETEAIQKGFETFHKKGYDLAQAERMTSGPYSADFRRNSDARRILQTVLTARGVEIALELDKQNAKAPKHQAPNSSKPAARRRSREPRRA